MDRGKCAESIGGKVEGEGEGEGVGVGDGDGDADADADSIWAASRDKGLGHGIIQSSIPKSSSSSCRDAG